MAESDVSGCNSEIFGNINPSSENSSSIKHLVISSGLIYGLSFYGALKECALRNVYNIDNIETIYATSAGTIVAVMISLKYDWESIDNYIINRPWSRVFPININTIINAFQSCGILDISCIKELFSPLFRGRELDIDITMVEFREFTGIDFHFFTTRLDTFEVLDINADSCPEWTVVEAVYASCAVPILFQPFFKDGCKYADGAFLSKYPISHCLNDKRVHTETDILGISLGNLVAHDNSESDSESDSIIFSPMLHYIYMILSNLVKKIANSKISITNEIIITPKDFQLNDIYSVVNSKEERAKYIELGVDMAKMLV